MTKNQIDYWNMQEGKRHNQVTERETERHGRATEQLQAGTLEEATRHDLAAESIDISKLGESQRHNQASEALEQGKIDLGRLELSESQRSHRANESLQGVDLNIRAAQQSEAARHNFVNEGLSRLQTVAETELKRSQTELNEIETKWRDLLKSQEVEINAAKKRQIEQQIAESKKQVELAQSNILRNNVSNITSSVNAAGQMIRGVGSLIDAVTPF